MKNSKKHFNTAGQSTIEVKKSQKHDANLQKNSSLYFQIGLILCLLGSYALFEMQFQKKTIKVPTEFAESEPVSIDYVEPYVVELLKSKEPEPLPSKDLTDNFISAKNDRPVIETVIQAPDAPKFNEAPAVNPNDIVDAKPIEDLVDVIFVNIEKVPIYPGCEKFNTNEERKQCMSDKITKLVAKKFNINVGSTYGISGKQRIHTEFTIDKNGNVTNVKIRGPHQALEKEAKRVINFIPKMQPGLQRNLPVGVIYTLPIVYDARN